MKKIGGLSRVGLGVGIYILLALGCKRSTISQPDISVISFINLTNGSPALNFYLDATQINNKALSFLDSLPYTNIYSGPRTVAVYQGSTKKLSVDTGFVKNKFFSVVLAGSWANPGFLFLEDNLVAPGAEKAGVRFINASADAPALDLVLSSGTVIASDKAFKVNSSFVELSGGVPYSFVIREHANPGNKITLASVELQVGKVYTIYAAGNYSENGMLSLTGKLFRHL